MTTTVSWFPDVSQARDAILDLFTSGVPRETISVLISNAAVAAERDFDPERVPPFVSSLPGAQALSHPEIGPIVVAGPLAEAISGAGAAPGGIVGALAGIGIAADQAQTYASELRGGGALLAVQADSALDTTVGGVFHQNENPVDALEDERSGPTLDDVSLGKEPGLAETSIGGMTSGAIPGGWGTTDPLTEDRIVDAPSSTERPERDL